MDHITLEWDETKNQKNQQKHKISFEEAKPTFYEQNALVIFDPDHSEDKGRFILMDQTKNLNLLVEGLV